MKHRLTRPHRLTVLWPLLIAALAVAAALSTAPAPAAASGSGHVTEPPVFAYYYIWFDRSSWNRAKTDYPLLGRYSSDEGRVMRKHIELAKEAGIDGFTVSWKDTPTLNERLAELIRIADQERFKLQMIYEGLDFERLPLPVDTVRADMRYFEHRWGDEPVFDSSGDPVMIWSGTWKFSNVEIASVTRRVTGLQILASEHNLQHYEEIADLVDGDAYYWSSVNPDTFPGYDQKLVEMGAAVHARDGIWIAPAAPGFDARLIGGTTVVDRSDGDTLRREYDAAIGSSPDQIGLISWNEFSENSHVEPSERYGAEALNTLADIRGAPTPDFSGVDFDSDGSAAVADDSYNGVAVVGGLAALIVVCLTFAMKRREDPEEDGVQTLDA